MNEKKMTLYAIMFMFPAIAVILWIDVVPIFQNFYNSFFSWDILDPSMRFVGLGNFVGFFKMEGARTALKNTLIYASLSAVLKNAAGLMLALLFNCNFKTKNILRACVLSMTMISLVISGYTWTYLYHPAYGIGHLLDTHLGLSFLNQDWLGNPSLVLYSVLMVSVWQFSGKYMVIYLAGLQAVPQEIHEACTIDGASPWMKFKSVTLPLIIPAVTVGVLNSIIQGLKVFDEIYAMTKGGPGFASETLSSMMFTQTFFYSGKAGFGSAISTILFLIVLAASLVVSSRLRRIEDAVYA